MILTMGMYFRHRRCGFWMCLVTLLMLSRLGSGYTTNDILENASRPAKVKAFVACRKECIQRCDTLVYRFERNQYHCHKCLDECMRLFLKQAQSVGVEFGNTGGDKKKRKRKVKRIAKNDTL
ncbi:uncharacterized protein LOC135496747 isoform X2 [Lineus longissimus]|uniref:uncharacterized protein LOC135496747 isoform X2 n=1 Tax=Lineus longissimus TaxID=88925 RepID=UPI00315D6DE8